MVGLLTKKELDGFRFSPVTFVFSEFSFSDTANEASSLTRVWEQGSLDFAALVTLDITGEEDAALLDSECLGLPGAGEEEISKGVGVFQEA